MFPNDFNHTYITLILKKKCHEKIVDFRPITIFNVFYKIVAKVLANRLKCIIPNIISQSAYIPSRHIIDNVLVAYEFMHYLNLKRTEKNGFMSLELDMSKEYDRVD